MCVNDIIEKTLSTSGNMTVVIENLRKDEFVKKEKDIFDRRKFVISLTYKGKMLIEEIFDKHAENTVEFFDDMKKNEKQELLALLLKLRSEK
jgi:DNA-binding MarR family transcriptional regulator